jgi:hypothetical protein
MSMKKSSDTIGNRTRDLPACSAEHVDQGEAKIKMHKDKTSLYVIYHVAFDDDR